MFINIHYFDLVTGRGGYQQQRPPMGHSYQPQSPPPQQPPPQAAPPQPTYQPDPEPEPAPQPDYDPPAQQAYAGDDGHGGNQVSTNCLLKVALLAKS